jgi:hypothetical protein
VAADKESPLTQGLQFDHASPLQTLQRFADPNGEPNSEYCETFGASFYLLLVHLDSYNRYCGYYYCSFSQNMNESIMKLYLRDKSKLL